MNDEITPHFEDNILVLMKGGNAQFEAEEFKSFMKEAFYLAKKHAPKETLEDVTHLLSVLEKKVLRALSIVTVVDGTPPQESLQSSESVTGLNAVLEGVAGLTEMLEAETRPPSPTTLLTPPMNEKNMWEARPFDTHSVHSEESQEGSAERFVEEVALGVSGTPVKPGAVFTGTICEKLFILKIKN